MNPHLPPEDIQRLTALERGAVRILVRVATARWPELAGRVLVYLLDGEDLRTAQIPVYLPDTQTWIHVASSTAGAVGGNAVLTARASHQQTDQAREAMAYELQTRVIVCRSRGGQGGR